MASHTILSLIALAAAALIPARSAAAEPADSVLTQRPVYASYTLTAGSSHIADTYLSPVRYSGWSLGFDYNRLQAMKFDPERWVQRLNFGIHADRVLNSRGNTTVWDADLHVSWGMMRRWKLPQGFSAGIGGQASAHLGCIYLSHNGNNPASAKAALTVDVTGYAAWNGTVLNMPVTLRYQAAVPLTGAFFAPDYGELYYEIYLGNRSGLAHAAWWGNYFRLTQRLTADINFGATSLTLGYEGNVLSTKAEGIVTRMIRHAAIIGVSGQWISVDTRRPLSARTRTITATY